MRDNPSVSSDHREPGTSRAPGQTAPVPQPATADLPALCEQARQDALRARTAYHQATMAYAAHLIREALPNAAAVTVDTDDGELWEVRADDGTHLFSAPSATTGGPWHASKQDDIEALFRELIEFGGLAETGWDTAPQGLPLRTTLLPGGTQPPRRTVHTVAAAPGRVLRVQADFVPGGRAFNVQGPHPLYHRETEDRVQAAIRHAGFPDKDGTLTATAQTSVRDATDAGVADLALAVTALAAARHISADRLRGVALIGALDPDGSVRPVRGVNAAVGTACAAGCRTAIVAAADRHTVDVADCEIHGLEHLSQIRVLLGEAAARG